MGRMRIIISGPEPGEIYGYDIDPEREEQYRFVCQAGPVDYIAQEYPEYSLFLRIIRIE